MTGYADASEWDESGTYYGLRSEGNRLLRGPDGWIGHLAYDPHDRRTAEVCNVSRQDGCVCRLPRGHDGLHVPFSGELVGTTGVFVESIGHAAQG